jgi:multidrug efflux pump subunit AcrA (membrane-fusion protein)
MKGESSIHGGALAWFVLLAFVGFAQGQEKVDPKRSTNTVVLTEAGVKNLRIESVEVGESDFEETVFALGRIRVAPGHGAVISSRVPGRAVEVKAHVDTRIEKGAEAVILESRQPGDPPPRITLTAPISGMVAEVKVLPGQPVSADDSLIKIVDLSEVHAVAAVPEHLIGKLRVGQKAHLRVSAYPDRTFEAQLAHIGAEADSASGTLEAAFHVENPETLLRPGMRAEFSIVVGKREGVVSVPRNALQGDVSNRFVYVEDFDLPHAFVRSPVVVGQMNDRFVEITSGLLPGDKVVTRGAYSLAFAGGSSISLKAALDAAHGHEHNEDGSELTPEQKAAKARAAAGGGDGHDHEESSLVWKIVSGVLFVLLLLSTIKKRGRAGTAEPEGVR